MMAGSGMRDVNIVGTLCDWCTSKRRMNGPGSATATKGACYSRTAQRLVTDVPTRTGGDTRALVVRFLSTVRPRFFCLSEKQNTHQQGPAQLRIRPIVWSITKQTRLTHEWMNERANEWMDQLQTELHSFISVSRAVFQEFYNSSTSTSAPMSSL